MKGPSMTRDPDTQPLFEKWNGAFGKDSEYRMFGNAKASTLEPLRQQLCSLLHRVGELSSFPVGKRSRLNFHRADAQDGGVQIRGEGQLNPGLKFRTRPFLPFPEQAPNRLPEAMESKHRCTGFVQTTIFIRRLPHGIRELPIVLDERGKSLGRLEWILQPLQRGVVPCLGSQVLKVSPRRKADYLGETDVLADPNPFALIRQDDFSDEFACLAFVRTPSGKSFPQHRQGIERVEGCSPPNGLRQIDSEIFRRQIRVGTCNHSTTHDQETEKTGSPAVRPTPYETSRQHSRHFASGSTCVDERLKTIASPESFVQFRISSVDVANGVPAVFTIRP
jgi:hypothetical protein